MKTENKVISLKLAKKIWETAKKKGIELPESKRYYVKEGKGLLRAAKLSLVDFIRNVVPSSFFPAYDVAELLEMLPGEVDGCSLCVEKLGEAFYANYSIEGLTRRITSTEIFMGKKLPEALGNLFLYLLENDLWKGKKEK